MDDIIHIGHSACNVGLTHRLLSLCASCASSARAIPVNRIERSFSTD
jgi:hypothetical protein